MQTELDWASKRLESLNHDKPIPTTFDIGAFRACLTAMEHKHLYGHVPTSDSFKSSRSQLNARTAQHIVSVVFLHDYSVWMFSLILLIIMLLLLTFICVFSPVWRPYQSSQTVLQIHLWSRISIFTVLPPRRPDLLPNSIEKL